MIEQLVTKSEWWAQSTGRHESSPVMSVNQPSPTHPSTQHKTISSLINSSNVNNDNRQVTGSILAYLIINEIGSDFDGALKLVSLASNAPECASKLYSELQKIPSDTRQGLKSLTVKVSLDPMSYQHHITKVYKDFMQHIPNYEPGKPTFGMLIGMISYLVELCRHFLEHDRGYEIPSIHAHATRLMLDPVTPLSPTDWDEYLKNNPVQRTGTRQLSRRSSVGLATEAVSVMFYLYDAYSKFTR